PYEVGHAEHRQGALAFLLEVRGPVRGAHLDGDSRDGHQVEEAPRGLRKPRHADLDQGVEGEVRCSYTAAGRPLAAPARSRFYLRLRKTHELFDEVRVAPGLAGDRLCTRPPVKRLPADERQGQLVGLRSGQL